MIGVMVTSGAIRRDCQIVITSIQTPNLLQAGCPYCHPTNSVTALKGDSKKVNGTRPNKRLDKWSAAYGRNDIGTDCHSDICHAM